jgi:hypothetical protein
MARKTGHTLFFNLPKDWRETIENGFREGWSDIEAHLAIGVSATEHEILLKNEDYLIEFKNGMALSEAYWMSWARSSIQMESKLVNTKLFDRFMDRVFKWDSKIKGAEEKEEKKEVKKRDARAFAEKYKLIKNA